MGKSFKNGKLILDNQIEGQVKIDSKVNGGIIVGPSAPSSGTIYHDKLRNRELPDQHPIEAITGLQDALDEKVSISDLSEVAFSGSYTDLIDKPFIPTSVSDLINDVGFITNTVDNLVNYYDKSETYTKQEIEQIVGSIASFHIEVVQELPTEDISLSTIYLVPLESPKANNHYEEYIYVNNSWELIGTTEIDLTNYYTKSEVDALVDRYTAGNGIIIANYQISMKNDNILDCGTSTIQI